MAQKITIEPVTRIEGHATVTVYIDDNQKVEKALFHVNEFRGFEKFCEGRTFFEMPLITERICGIGLGVTCFSKVGDRIIGVEPPRPPLLPS
jgi:NAD-reducing hydrogenase large subunit